MISKRQSLILWSSFLILALLSVGSACFGLVMLRIIPMALNDSSPNFGQLPDTDRWSVYHTAQSLMTQVTLAMLVLVILWAALAGFTIWKLSKKAEHEIHDAA
jgi:hypothetical protein